MALQLLTSSLPVSLLCVALSYVIIGQLSKKKVQYPPGPSPKPLVGNAFDIPIKRPWITYVDWAKKYNTDILHMSVMGMHLVVVQTMEDAVELLDRRSANYSSRPPSGVVDLLGMGKLVMMLPYAETLKKHRRLLEGGLRKDVVPKYHDVQAEKVHMLLEQLLTNPDGFKEHCKTLGTSVIMALSYGYDIIPGQKDRYVDPAEFSADVVGELTLPGKTLISVFPFLRHIPTWFPGASTQRIGAQVRVAGEQYRTEPYEYVKKHMAAGTARDSMLKQILERRDKGDGVIEDEDIVMDAISGLYLAAVETTRIVQVVFIMAMALNPEQQKRAQEEIDTIIGTDRLPTLADRPAMPYIEALYREVLRWRPIAPLGFGHSTLEDDVYKGYHIPKGTIVMPNVWAITRNEAVYPDPESFNPLRFLKPDGTLNDDTITYMFGFGRRICIGRHVADAVVWLMIASVLASFKISKAKDDFGREIDIDSYGFVDGMTIHPLPFKCSIVPRTPQAESLVRVAAANAWQSMKRPE